MRKKLLLVILPMLLFVATIDAQNKVWDFGNDTANWPVSSAALTAETTVDGLTLVPGGGSSFGVVEANSAIWFSGEANEYTAVNRWKSGGNSNVDPSDGVTFMPTRRYITFPVDGPVSVKIWFRQGGTSTPRDLWVTNGTAEVTHHTGLGDTDPRYIEANYLGAAGNLYVFFAGNAYNLYKLEISSTLLSVNNFSSPVSTNLFATKGKIIINNVSKNSEIKIYNILGGLVKDFTTKNNTEFNIKSGLYFATIKTSEGKKSIKLLVE